MTPDQTQPTPPQGPSFQLADLVLVLKLIQITAQRGAIRAEEMAEVGALYEKLVKFLTAAGAIQPAKPAETTEEKSNG